MIHSIETQTENDMAVYGYIRVSTEGKGQTTENQRKVITDAGYAVTEFFSEDGVSGSVRAFNRPVFKRMIEKCQPNDQIIITMIDRLGRSASDILNVVEDLKQRGIKLKVMQFDGMDITSAMGKMILTCMSAMAELERNLLIERTNAGLARTVAQGTKLGRPLTIKPSILRSIVSDRVNSGLSFEYLSGKWHIPRNTIHRTVTEWGDKLDAYEAEWNSRQQQYLNNGK
jgi:putative DNA-invertase from lambdoid prophage Rac